MDPLSMHVANAVSPRLPESAVAAATEAPSALPPAVGQVRTGLGALAKREIAVGPGEDRRRAQTARSIIGSILSAVSSAIQTIVLSPLTLSKKLASYVMRAMTPAPSPAVVKFHEEVTILTGALANQPRLQQPASVPRGLHEDANKDWLRYGITINGNVYGGDDGEGALDMEIAAKLLTRMCGDNPATAEWVSRFANQQIGMPFMRLLMEQPMAPNAPPGFLFLGGSISHSISVLPDGGIEVEILYQWNPSKSADMYLNADAHFPVDAKSSLTARCAIRLELPENSSTHEMPVVSLHKPLSISSNVIHQSR